MSLASIALTHCLPVKEFEKQYKDHLSGFRKWDQKDHADKWILFEKNIGENLSIDEVAVTNGELYTIVTNKAGKGGQGSLIAIVEGVKAADIIAVLSKIPKEKRDVVKEVTLDMSNAMDAIIRASFKNADIVTDRFHVQQLVSDALQEVRGGLRRAALKEETEAILLAKKEKKIYQPKLFENGDTKKQLLARSFHLLFKASSKWTEKQQKRAAILFREFPAIDEAYKLSMMLRAWYEHNTNKEDAKQNIQNWYQKVEEKKIASFLVAAHSIQAHEDTILNYFNHRSTNASAESFNAKLKGFRALVRGVRDIKFFLFRVGRIYG
ncbi:MAG: transposase [Bacteroidetes bacterium RIFCSPHIGHO2_02_FULL_44_7]|nr:MAG: transposase [Bacteroidetes bacterium RIFCSPHIGHO2_02_FULL_44_7]